MIRAIIFDFDSTIYIGDIGDSDKRNDKTVVRKSFGEGVYERLNKKYYIDKKDIKDIIDVCKKEGMDYKKLATCFENELFIHQIKDKIEILPNEFFEELSEKYDLYIVSMSPIHYLEYYFSLYDINQKCFKRFLNLNLIKHTSKGDVFKFLIKNEKYKPNEILMIGDNYSHDIEPALKLNMNALHFRGDFNQIYDYMTKNNICDCTKYKKNRKFIYANQ